MVDETEFRDAYRQLNEIPCPFKKAIFSTVCACSRNERLYIGDREVLSCRSPAAQQRCLTLLGHLREAARFMLKVTSGRGELPHAKRMKVETGGLLGLKAVIAPENGRPGHVEDVYDLLDQAEAEFETLAVLPYPRILQEMARFKPRSRRSRNKRDWPQMNADRRR